MSEEIKKFQIIGSLAPTEEEMLQLLMEMDIVQPLSDANSALYTDANDKVYVL